MSGQQQADAAIENLGYISKKLREAIAVSLPSAAEQYVTISIPGLIVDTRDDGDGEYILGKEQRRAHDRINEIACNEARLVDSMIPLDTVMLGPTGKSVTRSYLTALDHLVPRKTDIGDTSIEFDEETTDPNKPLTKYAKAMSYLKSVDSDPKAPEDKRGALTTVGRYVEKQLLWAKAQGEWVSAKSQSLDGTLMTTEQQSAEGFSQRQEKLQKAKAELQARYMDWVVNGNKFRVDHSFALVDRDTIMGRIEKAREITRSQMLTSAAGVDWAAVSLEPKSWATICNIKALNWGGLDKAKLDSIDLQIARLKQEKIAYKAYQDHHGKAPNTPINYPFPLSKEKENALNKLKKAMEDLTPPKPKDGADGTGVPAGASGNNQPRQIAAGGSDNAQAGGVEGVDGPQTGTNKSQASASTPSTYEQARMSYEQALDALPKEELEEAFVAIYKAEDDLEEERKKDPQTATRVKECETKLEEAKKKCQEATRQLQAYQTMRSVMKMENEGNANLAESSKNRLSVIDAEIETLEQKRGTMESAAPPGMIKGVDQTGYVERGDSAPEPPSKATKDEKADVWTKVTFSIASKRDNNETSSSNWSGGAKAKYSGLFASVEASSSVSKSSALAKKQMAECSVDGSFSAMLVQIKRPWLHSDIFSDYAIDTMPDSRLSPGAQALKYWIESGNRGSLDPYSEFPAYPTAFIVAADTVLELKTSDSNSASLMTALQTDSSVKASYGPWGISGEASLKTDNKNSNQTMEMKNGLIKIQFQAPQIIGWVSEILPKLPRDPPTKENVGAGGLIGAPTMAFRSKL